MRLREIIQKALKIGGRRGFITFDQLNELCDGNPKLEPVDIETLKAALTTKASTSPTVSPKPRTFHAPSAESYNLKSCN